MNAIVGLTEIAKHYEDDPKKIEDYLDKIDVSSKVLLNIINDILDMSSIENKKMKIAKEPFDLHEILMSVGTIYEPQCRQKGIAELIQHIRPGKLIPIRHCMADRDLGYFLRGNLRNAFIDNAHQDFIFITVFSNNPHRFFCRQVRQYRQSLIPRFLQQRCHHVDILCHKVALSAVQKFHTFLCRSAFYNLKLRIYPCS